MKVLLIGGTGRLSADTTQLCIEREFDVYLLNRGTNNSLKAPNLQYLIGNVNDLKSVSSVLKDYSFDVVVDYLTYNLDTLKKRIVVFKNKTKQYIFISSATVFKPQGKVISEGSQIGNDEWVYCKEKLECERFLAEQKEQLGFAYTIVRPYVTYDKNRIPFPIISKKSCWNLLYRINNGLPVLMCGDGEQRITLTNTKDFAVAMVGLLGNQEAYYEDFNIVGDYSYTWNEVVKELEKLTNRRINIVNVPMDRIKSLVPSFYQEVLFDKGLTHIFENGKIKRVVPQFQPKITLEDGLRETFEHLSADKKQQSIDFQWNALENVVARKMGCSTHKVSFKDRKTYFFRESEFALLMKIIIKKFR